MDEVVEKVDILNDRAVLAKQSEAELERLIEEFKPFLNARVAKYTMHSSIDQREEMFSTALMAFYEAIKSYDSEKGHFYPFANRVVCGRLIDHIRGIYRRDGRTVPLEEEDEDQQIVQSSALVELSLRTYDERRKHETLVAEIEQFRAELNTWGITMDVLAKQSPKHQKLREAYRTCVTQICHSPDIVQTIQIKRYFPIKAVADITGLPQKKLERARTFILASLIIKMGDYDYLSEYVNDGWNSA